MNAKAVIDVQNVSLRRDNKTVLEDVSFVVRQGEHWVLLGANGAGKSTVLGLCGAQSFPTVGRLHLLGHQVGRVELQALRRSIGHVDPRHRAEPTMTVTEVVLTGLTGSTAMAMRWQASTEEQRRAAVLLAVFGLGGKGDQRWAVLSQGERGRALIARALIARPAIVLLDEPATGLDVAAREQLLQTIRDLARSDSRLASVLVTHHFEEIPETSTHALLLSHGRVVDAGRIEHVLTDEQVTRAFEHPLFIERRGSRWAARATPAPEPVLEG